MNEKLFCGVQSLKPSVYKGATTCIVLSDVVAVTVCKVSYCVEIHLRGGSVIKRVFTGTEAESGALDRFEEMSKAVMEFNS